MKAPKTVVMALEKLLRVSSGKEVLARKDVTLSIGKRLLCHRNREVSGLALLNRGISPFFTNGIGDLLTKRIVCGGGSLEPFMGMKVMAGLLSPLLYHLEVAHGLI